MTDGCLAVNVIGNHDITCELTTGLSNENEMQDDSSSRLFVSSKDKLFTFYLQSELKFVLMDEFLLKEKVDL